MIEPAASSDYLALRLVDDPRPEDRHAQCSSCGVYGGMMVEFLFVGHSGAICKRCLRVWVDRAWYGRRGKWGR